MEIITQTDYLNNQKEIKKLVNKRIKSEQVKISDQKINDVSDSQSSTILKGLNDCEDGDARLFIDIHRGRLCYDHAASVWHIFKGHSWQEDEVDEATEGIQGVIDLYGFEAQKQAWQRLKATKSGRTKIAEQHKATEDALLKRIQYLQTARRKRNILQLAKAGKNSLGITGQEWDRDPWLLCCKNGVIDLKTGNHRPGKSNDYIKTVAPVQWKGLETPCPKWERFLNEIFEGNLELIAYVRRLLGYGITGKSTEHIFPVLEGQGRNGKGVILETLKCTLGNVAYKTEPEILLKASFNRHSGTADASLMAFRGRRIIWASETDENCRLDTSKVKELVGGDTLNGRVPYGRRQVEFTPTHLLLLLTNNKPHIPANDYALWARLHLIPFKLSFIDKPTKPNERKADPNLQDELKVEGSGILAWLVRGCLAWQKEGLNPPEIVQIATQAYQEDEDLISHFFEDCCVTSPDAEVKAGQLYAAYKKWCESMGHDVKSGTAFGKEIKLRFDSYKTTHVFYIGIGLRFKNLEGLEGLEGFL